MDEQGAQKIIQQYGLDDFSISKETFKARLLEATQQQSIEATGQTTVLSGGCRDLFDNLNKLSF